MSGKLTKPMSLDEIRRMKGQTDWERLRKAGDHEGEPEVDIDWDAAEVVIPEPKKLVSLRLDADVLDFFRGQGKGYQTRMNAVLRSYMDAQKKSV